MNFVSCAGRSQREREGIKAPGAMRNLCNSVGVNVCQMQGTHWALRDLEVNLRKSVSQYNRSPPPPASASPHSLARRVFLQPHPSSKAFTPYTQVRKNVHKLTLDKSEFT